LPLVFIFKEAVTAHPILKNPVARCADAGVMNFCGEYFISGVGLPGQFLISPDLVEWQGPVSFFQTKADWLDRSDEKEMHAPGMRYINGKFYFYWNGIGYAFTSIGTASATQQQKNFSDLTKKIPNDSTTKLIRFYLLTMTANSFFIP